MTSALLNPLVLFGLAALAVPILIHLVERQTRVGTTFPSLMFLQQMTVRAKLPKRLRDPVLLFLRCLALLLLVLGFAGPQCAREPTATAASATNARDTVVLLDASYSMSASNRWSEAIGLVKELCTQGESSERFALVIFAQTAAIEVALERGCDVLLQRLETIRPRARTTRIDRAFVVAAHVLAKSVDRRRRVVLVSDLPPNGFVTPPTLTNGIELVVSGVGTEPLKNATLLNAQLVPSLDAGHHQVNVTLSNTGDERVQTSVSTQVDGKVIATTPVDLARNTQHTVNVLVPIDADGEKHVTFQLSDDDVDADNHFYIVLAPPPQARALIVEPSKKRAHQSAYLGAALGVVSSPRVVAQTVTVDGLTRAALATTDIVILNDVELAGAALQRVQQYASNGGGLIVFAGRNTTTQMLKSFAPSGSFKPAAPAQSVGVDARSFSLPFWADTPGLDPSTSPARLHRYWRIRLSTPWAPVLRTQLDEVVAAYAGATVIVGTSSDTDWNDLALAPTYIPMLQALLEHASGRATLRSQHTAGDIVALSQIVNGEDAVVWRKYFQDLGRVVVQDPTEGRESVTSGRYLFATDEPGFYEVYAEDISRRARIAVNAPRAEANFERLAESEFRQAVVRSAPDASRIVQDRPSEPTAQPRPTGLEWWLLAFAIVALILECGYANAIARRQAAT
ncbi:MAG: BatA and WFA domain-containing protein [Gammaproteobacteria bacterium]|nr:BatA and WFA domain-containing protein [Gammaproteobacteria bacterium]